MEIKNNLPNWGLVTTFFKQGISVEELGFSSNCSHGAITRVNARYRVAKSFKSIELDNFTKETQLGYSALVKTLLTYSALETYIKLFNSASNVSIPLESINLEIINIEDANLISNKILNLDKNKKFYNFISYFSDKDNIKNNIEKFYNEEEHNIIFLLAGMRHIFGHGYLSASSNKITPIKVNQIGNLISDFVLESMANHFSKTIEKYKKSI